MTDQRCWQGGESRFYFAYGSNMNPQRMTSRGLRWRRAAGATLTDHQLVFDKVASVPPRSGHANVRRGEGGGVEGVLYLLEDFAMIGLLDRFERTPVNYSRELFLLQTDSAEPVWGWVYVANAGARAAGLRPTRSYVDHLLAGRELLSAGYVAMLERVQTV